MNVLRVGFLFILAIVPQRLAAESPSEMLKELREAGASMCISGSGIAMSVGRDRWTKGNEGLAPLRHRLPKSIAFLNVYPIDGKPLSKTGLSHIASAPEIRRLSFKGNAIAGSGFRHFVESANKNPKRPRWVVLCRVSTTDNSIEWIARYKQLKRLEFRDCTVSPEDLAALKRSLPECKITCSPPLDVSGGEKGGEKGSGPF